MAQPAPGAGKGGYPGLSWGWAVALAASLLGILLLGACSILPNSRSTEGGAASPGGGQQAIFVPPTLPASASKATDKAVAQAQTPTPPQACSDNLLFLDDLSIKDGSVFPPGVQLDKRWQVENNGTCNWDRRYLMKLIAGSEMGVPAEQALYPARSGSQAVIRIVFTAPTEPGNYRSAWQAYDPQDQPFGDPFYIDIVVETPTPAP